MERNIVHWTYWLGIVSLLIALLWRAFNALGLWLPMYIREGEKVYFSALRLVQIAKALEALAKSERAEFIVDDGQNPTVQIVTAPR